MEGSEAEIYVGIETSFSEIFKSINEDTEKLLSLANIFGQFVTQEAWSAPTPGFRYLGYFDKTEDYNESISKLYDDYPREDFNIDCDSEAEKIDFVKFVYSCLSPTKRRILFDCKIIANIDLGEWSCGSDELLEGEKLEKLIEELKETASKLGIINPKIKKFLFHRKSIKEEE